MGFETRLAGPLFQPIALVLVPVMSLSSLNPPPVTSAPLWAWTLGPRKSSIHFVKNFDFCFRLFRCPFSFVPCIVLPLARSRQAANENPLQDRQNRHLAESP